jgi:hypothetical protein
VCSNASAWSDGSSWSQWSASSRLWCHTRCAASNGPRWGECVDVGSEPLLGASASGVGRLVLTTYRRCDPVGGAGGRRRLSVGGDPAEWLDRAGMATSPVGLAGSRGWDRLRTSTGIDRIAGAGLGVVDQAVRDWGVKHDASSGWSQKRRGLVRREVRSIHSNGATPPSRGCGRWPFVSVRGSCP